MPSLVTSLGGLGYGQAIKVNSAVTPIADLSLPAFQSPGGTRDVVNALHRMTLASQTSNLWSIPTDCPQRERRGWMGDAQASSDEAHPRHPPWNP